MTTIAVKRVGGPVLSDAALAHLQVLLLHRGDVEVLCVEIHPGRCNLCEEIAEWSEQKSEAQA